jgi:xylitol oxidase
MRSTTSELNWSGTVTYTGERIVRPSSIDEAAQVVADADRVHGLGTRHSFNDVADTPGVLLDLTGIPTDLVVDAEHRTVTLGAGTRYGDVAADIDRAGFALHNTGSLPHISVGGAVATAPTAPARLWGRSPPRCGRSRYSVRTAPPERSTGRTPRSTVPCCTSDCSAS